MVVGSAYDDGDERGDDQSRAEAQESQRRNPSPQDDAIGRQQKPQPGRRGDLQRGPCLQHQPAYAFEQEPAGKPRADEGADGKRKAGKSRLPRAERSEEHTSELQSLMRISYAVFCLNKKKNTRQ